MSLFRRALMAFAAVGALLLALAVPASAADTFPSQDACHVTNNSMPKGNCGKFTQLSGLTFNAVQVPAGAFSGCAQGRGLPCAGLKTKYPSYYSSLGAYPTGWPDAAASGADGNNGPVPGYYHPEKPVSVIKTEASDGTLNVYITSTGEQNSVAAVVPRQCMNLRYGKFTERTRITARTPGFKMAHLRYPPNEVDYPEAGQTFATDPISEFTHGFRESGADVAPHSAWTSWHTFSTEIAPGSIRFYLDGRLVKTVSGDFPDAADWILQNESALGPVKGAVAGASVDVITSWLTCYRYSG